jgi:hypothetical protein
MKTTARLTGDLDEVERCRQVRRALEREHHGLDGLCDWLEALQRQHERQSGRTARPRRVTGNARRKSRSRG